MIRKCEQTDLEEISVIHSDNIKDTYKGLWSDEYIENFSPEDRYRILSNYIYDTHQRAILVYEENDEILGFIAFHFRSAEDCGKVKFLHVKKSARRKGIGRSLIRAAMGTFFQNGIKTVSLEVLDRNDNACALYESLGAVECCRYKTVSYGCEICNKTMVWADISEIADTSSMPYISKSDSFSAILKNEFVLFGAGSWCNEFMEQFPDAKPCQIFENDPSKWGTFINGIPVVSPRKHNNVIITSILYKEIRNQLKGLGCENITDFCP